MQFKEVMAQALNTGRLESVMWNKSNLSRLGGLFLSMTLTATALAEPLDLESASGRQVSEKIDPNLVFRGPRSSSQGTGSSGGGDPENLVASPFADEGLLKKALNLAIETVRVSFVSEALKQNFKTEAWSLFDKKRYLVLPAIVILPQQGRVFGYQNGLEEGQFLTLGAFTPRFEVGAPIYFSQVKVSKYSVHELAQTLMHEVFHHLLPVELSADERFIEDLERAVILNRPTRSLMLALEQGLYLRRGYVGRDQFLAALSFEWRNDQNNGIYFQKEWNEKDFIRRLRRFFDENLFAYDLAVISHNIANGLLNYKPFLANDFRIQQRAHQMVLEVLLKLNPSLPNSLKDLSSPSTWSCVQTSGWIVKTCEGNRWFNIGEILSPVMDSQD